MPDQELAWLIYLYDKDEAEDITPNEKKAFREMTAILKGERK